MKKYVQSIENQQSKSWKFVNSDKFNLPNSCLNN